MTEVLEKTVDWMVKKDLIASTDREWLMTLIEKQDPLVLWAFQVTDSLEDFIEVLTRIAGKREELQELRSQRGEEEEGEERLQSLRREEEEKRESLLRAHAEMQQE